MATTPPITVQIDTDQIAELLDATIADYAGRLRKLETELADTTIDLHNRIRRLEQKIDSTKGQT